MSAPAHEGFPVYQRALRVVGAVELVARSLPPYRLDLRDQLRRASTSIVANIAEGASEYSKAEKARFYRIARRSASECLALLDVCLRVEEPTIPTSLRQDLSEIMAMLTGLINSLVGRR